MSENVRPKLPVDIAPALDGPASSLASALAPFLYFESAPVFGAMSGIIQITLEAGRLMPGSNGPTADRVVVAHLRMNRDGALSLRAALDQALLLSARPAGGQKAN